LYDLWKSIKVDKQGYTWCNGENIPKSRIDYVFLSEEFCYQYENIRLQNALGSHSTEKGCLIIDALFFLLSLVKNCVDQGIGSLTHPCLKMNRLQKK
jgi:hypothetical protein